MDIGGKGLLVNQRLSFLMCLLTASFSYLLLHREETSLSVLVATITVSDILTVFWFAGERDVLERNVSSFRRRQTTIYLEPSFLCRTWSVKSCEKVVDL